MWIKLIIFLLGSVGILIVSYRSFRKYLSHGIFRLVAWECILFLILLNIDYWFYHVFSWPQVVSWILLFISLYLVIESFYLIRKMGNPQKSRHDTRYTW